MSTQSIYAEISTLLITQAGFKERGSYVAKAVDVSGEEETLIFRQKNDQLILMNLTRNEELISKNPKESGLSEELFKEQFYQELRSQLGSNNALDHQSEKESNKGISLVGIYDKATGSDSKQDRTTKKALREALTFTKFDGAKAGAYIFADQMMSGGSATVTKTAVKTIEAVNLAQIGGKAIVSEREDDLKKITDEVRKNLKIEGRLGADFAKTGNGLNVARGDYITLIKDHAQRNGIFRALRLSQGTELKIIGESNKKGKGFAKCLAHNKCYDIHMNDIYAEYGKQYIKQYENNPKLKNKIDQSRVDNTPKKLTTKEVEFSMQMHKNKNKDSEKDKTLTLDF